MKIATSFLAAVLFTGALGALNNAVAQDGILSKNELAGSGYCHMKFPAISRSTLGSDQPVLEDSTSVIDFYGPCDTDPLGQDQVQDQKLENQHRLNREFSE